MNHRRLLRFALWMWAVPLVAGSLAFGGFLFMRSPMFAAAGLGLLVLGGLCLSAGIVAVIAIVITRNSFLESPRRYYKKPAMAALGLLLLNLPVAGLYTWTGAALLLEAPALAAAPGPSGRYLAEVVLLDEQAVPPYGVGVTLRPQPGLFWPSQRSVLFSGYCIDGPTITWLDAKRLQVECTGAREVGRKVTRYRDVSLAYKLRPVAITPKRTDGAARLRNRPTQTRR